MTYTDYPILLNNSSASFDAIGVTINSGGVSINKDVSGGRFDVSSVDGEVLFQIDGSTGGAFSLLSPSLGESVIFSANGGLWMAGGTELHQDGSVSLFGGGLLMNTSDPIDSDNNPTIDVSVAPDQNLVIAGKLRTTSDVTFNSGGMRFYSSNKIATNGYEGGAFFGNTSDGTSLSLELYDVGNAPIFAVDQYGIIKSTPTTGVSVEGDIASNVGQKCLSTFQAGLGQNLVGCIFTQTTTGTVSNTTSETDFTSTGVGTKTLPANFFVAGKTIRIKGRGFHSTSGTPTLRVKAKLGSTIVLDTGVQTSTAASNDGFMFEADITNRTTGATGTVFAQGFYAEKLTSPGSINNFAWTNTATTTINTTASQALSVTIQWGTASASNTISLTNFTIEVLN